MCLCQVRACVRVWSGVLLVLYSEANFSPDIHVVFLLFSFVSMIKTSVGPKKKSNIKAPLTWSTKGTSKPALGNWYPTLWEKIFSVENGFLTTKGGRMERSSNSRSALWHLAQARNLELTTKRPSQVSWWSNPSIMLSILNEDPSYEMEHWDVKMAFTQAFLEDEIFMYQPEGYEKKGQEKEICKLRKSLYGLKQSAQLAITVEILFSPKWLFFYACR